MINKFIAVFVVLSAQLFAINFNFPVEDRDEFSDHSQWLSYWVEIPQLTSNGNYQQLSLVWNRKQIAQWAMQNPSFTHFTISSPEDDGAETSSPVGLFYRGAPVVLNPSIHIYTKMQFPANLSDDPEVWQSSVKVDIDPSQLQYTDMGISLEGAIAKAKQDPEVQYFVMQTDELNPEVGNVQFFKEALPLSTEKTELLYKGPLKRY